MVAPVINMPSSKHSGVSGRDTQLFCQHSAESPLRGGYAQSLTKWAQTPLNQGGPEASWPSFVDPIARVRMIAWPNSAWTQGFANQIAVGLECAGYARFSKAEWLTAEGLKQLENLAHEWVYYWKLEQAAGNEIPLRWLTTSEVQKVMAGNRSIKGFCTHAQIDPNSRTDPGPNFPYDQLLKRIGEIIGGKVATASGTIKEDTLSAAEVKEIKNHITAETNRAIREGKNNGVGYSGTGKQDLWSKINEIQKGVKNMPTSVRRAPITSRNKGSEGKTYGLDTYISVNNANIWEVVDKLDTVLGLLTTIANSETTPAQEVVNQIKAQLSGLKFELVSQDEAEATEVAKVEAAATIIEEAK